MDNRYLISPKMQLLCLEILEFVEEHENGEKVNQKQIYNQFSTYPEPIVRLGINLLFNKQLLLQDFTTRTFTTNPLHPFPVWVKTLQHTRMHPTDGVCFDFKKHSAVTQYKAPYGQEISYSELTVKEYFRFREFYDYETMTIKPDNGYMFFARQFGALLCDTTGEKSTHVYIATSTDSSIVGFVSIANITSDTDRFIKLPYRNEQIFNVNFISTRTGFENQGIATNLLNFAITDVMNKEDLKLLCYNPICSQSKSVMEKVFKNSKYEIIDRFYLPLKESAKYGLLSGFIIKPNENTQTTEEENEN